MSEKTTHKTTSERFKAKKELANLIGEEIMKTTIKPDYYKGKKMDIIDVAYMFDLPFDIGNIWKYTARAGKKDPLKELEDLEKAKEYLNRRIEYIKSKK